MIQELLSDVLVFLAMLFIIIFAYMHLLVILGDGELSFSDTFKISYTTTYGELDDSKDDGFIAWMNFMIFTFAMTLVLMNLVIAIMSDSYEHVMEIQISADIDILIGDVLELEEIVSFFKTPEQRYEYFFISIPSVLAESEEGEWEGMLGKVTRTIKDYVRDINGDLEKIDKS